jgi:chemotaxis protein histidine kinase CheA
LEQAAAEHRFELTLIDELVQVPANKVAQFFESSWPLLKETEKIIQAHESLDEHAVKLLFVNAHTIKGAARSLQFKTLAHVIHEAEEVYSHALREKVRPDPTRLQSDMKKIMARFESYREVNRSKLNRAEDLRKVTVDRARMEQLHISLQNLAKKPSLSLDNLIEEIDKQTEILSSMIFERSLPIFEDYRERARTIAKDLGKEAPEVVCDVEDFSVSPVVQNTLNRCMIHFLRNALDHGIETAEERKAVGKNPRGRIEMLCRVQNRYLIMTLSDDGRGLAIEKLRQLAAKAGYASAAMPPQDVAALIFEAAFSTASSVSDISGRGVGLHAVRSFVEKQGGTVQLKLGAAMDPEGRYYRFHFILTLPLMAPELQLAG